MQLNSCRFGDILRQDSGYLSHLANKRTLENRSTSVSKKGSHVCGSNISLAIGCSISSLVWGANVQDDMLLDSDIHSFATPGIDDEGRCDIDINTTGPNASKHRPVHPSQREEIWVIDTDHCSEGVLSHPSDGEAWKHFDRCHPPFVADAPNMTAERNHHKVIQGKSTSRVSKLKFLASSSIRVKLSSTSSFNFGTHHHRLVYESSERLSNLELFKKLCKKNRHEGDNCDARSEKVARAHGIIANVFDLALDLHLDPKA
ncbi:hypothetical protein Tco_1043149 [Tanacetum coccineum]|uniref:Uncharacterized protein n=1 Tax=Tanacetum coccineum TaxID=301880 RepID=A0ABQ5GM70_9ASTR